MSFLKRLLGTDGRDALRALWHATVAASREREWYADCRAADSVEGRFDMIALVLSLVLLRMEQSPALAPKTALLTELFVEDMDRQLRDSGVGDLKVGKNMGTLMSALGGQLGALRTALADPDDAGDAALARVLARNMRLTTGDGEGELPLALAERTRALAADLAAADDDALLAGQLRP
jgi:cytochrome b pre-mRNA-processing protein 3